MTSSSLPTFYFPQPLCDVVLVATVCHKSGSVSVALQSFVSVGMRCLVEKQDFDTSQISHLLVWERGYFWFTPTHGKGRGISMPLSFIMFQQHEAISLLGFDGVELESLCLF